MLIFINIIIIIIGAVLFYCKLSGAGASFGLAAERYNAPEEFRNTNKLSDIVHGINDLGFAIFGVVLMFFGFSNVLTTYCDYSWLLYVSLFMLSFGLGANITFMVDKKINKEINNIVDKWKTQKHISKNHNAEVNYYRALLENKADLTISIILIGANLLMLMF